MSLPEYATKHGTIYITHPCKKQGHASNVLRLCIEPVEIIHTIHSLQKAMHFYCQVNVLAFHNAYRTEIVKEHKSIFRYS